VNTASRLQGAAPVGGVAVGEQTFVATKELFDYVELPPAELKGKAEPVRLFPTYSWVRIEPDGSLAEAE